MESANTLTSPLLRLPGELRNKVYAYVSDTPQHWVFIFDRNTVTCTPEPVLSTQRFSTFIASTGTCLQIRAETRLMPWRHYHWRTGDYKVEGYLNLARWLARIELEPRRLVWEEMSVGEKEFYLPALEAIKETAWCVFAPS
ncbi:hypothetical protein G6514_001680 [Epicoccum nigrum]|nr:hypothetical protein G6514_001680 [Epicoccum nigrum]